MAFAFAQIGVWLKNSGNGNTEFWTTLDRSVFTQSAHSALRPASGLPRDLRHDHAPVGRARAPADDPIDDPEIGPPGFQTYWEPTRRPASFGNERVAGHHRAEGAGKRDH